MNPVISYTDFMEFMRWSSNNQTQLLPVLLMKPSTMLYLNREHHLDQVFDYFDRRSKEVQFFLPGYSHYPSTVFADLLPRVRPYNENAIALNLHRLKKIYYSDNDFIEFIELLESNALNFHYYGNTELLFIKYIPGSDSELGTFDFSTMHRFNLSNMYYSYQKELFPVERFLEEVLHTIRFAKNDDEMIASIHSLIEE